MYKPVCGCNLLGDTAALYVDLQNHLCATAVIERWKWRQIRTSLLFFNVFVTVCFVTYIIAVASTTNFCCAVLIKS